MAIYTKLFLSGSSLNTPQILISSATSASAVQLHTNTSGSIDEVYLYAYNDSTSSMVLSVLWGSGATEPKDVVRTTVAPQGGRSLVVDGKLLQNGSTISAYATIANWVTVDGFVNRIT